jgi:hypothetical protein
VERDTLGALQGKFDPDAAPALASDGRPMGAKRAKALRDTAPGIEKLHSSIMACMADAASHAAERAEQAAKMEQVATVRWASVIEMQDMREWWKAQRIAILYEVRGPLTSTSAAAASTFPAAASTPSPATATPPPDVDVDAAI